MNINKLQMKKDLKHLGAGTDIIKIITAVIYSTE
jgi:hypothetical protein